MSLESGHSALAGKVDRKWQDCEYVLSYFGKGRQAQKNYLRYVEKGIPQGRRPELVGKRTCGFQGGRSILSCVTKSVSSGKKPDMRDYVNQV